MTVSIKFAPAPDGALVPFTCENCLTESPDDHQPGMGSSLANLAACAE
ncbi:hypothetical protein [Phenylobacterium sp.]